MARKRSEPEESMGTIVSSALSLVKRQGAAGVTVGAVAEEAGCAKGLVHYHFKTKQRLWDATAQRLSHERNRSWAAAFRASSPSAAIKATWDLLVDESVNGTTLAWTTMFGQGGLVSDQSVSEGVRDFSRTLGQSAQGMVERLGMRMRIPESEIGLLLGAVVTGAGFQLLAGIETDGLEGAYAAAWLGILALT
jgi:AcrR family transcriptional regulator